MTTRCGCGRCQIWYRACAAVLADATPCDVASPGDATARFERDLGEPAHRLSHCRETIVLRLAADGQSGAEIAAGLELSEGTVRNYLSEAINKIGGKNRVDAARIARVKGWL